MQFEPHPRYQTIEEEFEDRIRGAFVNNRAEYVIIDSRRQAFQAVMTTWGQEQGWIDEGELVEVDDQYSQLRYRLTPEGKKYFGL